MSRNKAALSQISIAVALALLPIASIAASYFSARSLLIVVFVPLGLMAFAGVRRGGNDLSYALLIGSFSLSLLLASTSASRNLIGFDIHQEYYVYSQTIGRVAPRNRTGIQFCNEHQHSAHCDYSGNGHRWSACLQGDFSNLILPSSGYALHGLPKVPIAAGCLSIILPLHVIPGLLH